MLWIALRTTFRDWWRGWSNEDLASALRKTENKGGKPGDIVWLTGAEFKAWNAFTRRHRLQPVATAVPGHHDFRLD